MQIEVYYDVEVDHNLGYLIYEANASCIGCHGGDLAGGPSAPILLGNKLTAEEVKELSSMVVAVCQAVNLQVLMKNYKS